MDNTNYDMQAYLSTLDINGNPIPEDEFDNPLWDIFGQPIPTKPCVYLITNKLTGKYYVGSTISSLNDRWIMHIHDSHYPKTNYWLNTLYNTDIHNFTFEIIECADTKEEVLVLEHYYMCMLHSTHPRFGYNTNMPNAGNKKPEWHKKTKPINYSRKEYWYLTLGKYLDGLSKNRIFKCPLSITELVKHIDNEVDKVFAWCYEI